MKRHSGGEFMDFSKFQPLFDIIEKELPRRKRTVLAIDGAAASGKTTLASFLAEKYGAEIVHMDDFFLPRKRKTEARLSEPDCNIDRERFLAEVLPFINSAEPFSYGRYDCSLGKVESNALIGSSLLVIVEGVYSLSHYFRENYDIKIMLTVEKETQLARLRERCEAWQYENFLNIWLPLEERYFSLCRIENACDMVF
jgi:uridine kinase